MNEIKIYKRNETNLKNAPSFLAPLLTVSMFAIFILLGFCIHALIVQNKVEFIVCISIIVSLLIFGWECDQLNWYYNIEYDFSKNNMLIYRYDLDSRIIPSKNNTVIVKIKDIKKIKEKNHELIIYGNINKKVPLSKEKKLNKISIVKIPEYNKEIIEKLNNLSFINNKQ